jgi:hypothetical protein
MATLISELPNSEISTKLNNVRIVVKENNIDNMDDNYNQIRNILSIKDYESEEFLDVLTNIIKGKLVKHNKSEKYWKYNSIKWVNCDVAEVPYLIDNLYEMYMNNLIYEDYISSEDKRKLKNRIAKWKKCTLGKPKIFNSLSQKIMVDENFLYNNNLIQEEKIMDNETKSDGNTIDITDEKIENDNQKNNINIKIDKTLKLPEVILISENKKNHDELIKRVENFIKENIVIVDDKKLKLALSDIYDLFLYWSAKHDYGSISKIMFGKIFKTFIPTYLKMTTGIFYTNIILSK